MINLCGNVLSFAYPSLILRSRFAQGSLNLRHILGCASSPTFLRCEPHKLLSFAQGSLGEIMNFEF